MSTDQAIEQEILAKGKTAPRVTPDALQAVIASEHYFTALDGVMSKGGSGQQHILPKDGGPDPSIPLGLLTFCILVLKNGFTVTGESACASPENFDAELGRKIARRNAEAKIWPLLGYELRTKLSEAPKRKVFTKADIKRWEAFLDPLYFGQCVRGITHCGRQVQAELTHIERLTEWGAVQALLAKLNAEPA